MIAMMKKGRYTHESKQNYDRDDRGCAEEGNCDEITIHPSKLAELCARGRKVIVMMTKG